MSTLLAGPDEWLSFGKTVTLLGTTAVAAYDDLTVLVDGLGQDVVKLSGAGSFVVDLASAQRPDVVALLNHNFSSVRIRLSNNADLSSAVVDVTLTPPTSPVAFLDLRALSFAAARYVGVTPTSAGVAALGEIVVTRVVALEAPIQDLSSFTEPVRFSPTLGYGGQVPLITEVLSRTVDVGFRLDVTDRDAFAGVLDACGMTGQSFLFIPESSQPEAYWAEWAEDLVAAITDAVYAGYDRLTLREETFSVL